MKFLFFCSFLALFAGVLSNAIPEKSAKPVEPIAASDELEPRSFVNTGNAENIINVERGNGGNEDVLVNGPNGVQVQRHNRPKRSIDDEELEPRHFINTGNATNIKNYEIKRGAPWKSSWDLATDEELVPRHFVNTGKAENLVHQSDDNDILITGPDGVIIHMYKRTSDPLESSWQISTDGRLESKYFINAGKAENVVQIDNDEFNHNGLLISGPNGVMIRIYKPTPAPIEITRTEKAENVVSILNKDIDDKDVIVHGPNDILIEKYKQTTPDPVEHSWVRKLSPLGCGASLCG